MVRKVRLGSAGAVCQVRARGNQGGNIHAEDSDRKVWLETLAEACAKTGWRRHAFVVMANHCHLLAETTEANPVAGMKKRLEHLYGGDS